MTEKSSTKPPVWFWIVSVIALLWNGWGVNMYLQQAYNTESYRAMYPDPEMLEMANNTPAWATAAYAIAVFAGLFGCVGLLLRKKWAKSIFVLSLLGVVVSMTYHLFMSKAFEVYGTEVVFMPIVVTLIAIFLVWFAKKGIAKDWLT
ncbi:MAG: hypothetical protein QNK20_04590 [Aureibaculum sp.]|nr:hypothetical protein [Aureibaculum sp.]